MKYSKVFLVSVLGLFLLCLVNANSSDRHESTSQIDESKRKSERFGVSDDSFEETGEEEVDDESAEYTPLGPPGINAYLFGRSIRKGGFNAWAGRRDLDRHHHQTQYKSHGKKSKKIMKMRQRRRPWGGSA